MGEPPVEVVLHSPVPPLSPSSPPEEPLRKPRVVAMILHRDGGVLLQHRDDRPDIEWPGAWSLFAGRVEPGETPEAAALREIEEELELRLQPPLSLVHHFESDGREQFVFHAPLRVPPAELTLREGQGMALVPAGEMDLYAIIPSFRRILDDFFAAARGQER